MFRHCSGRQKQLQAIALSLQQSRSTSSSSSMQDEYSGGASAMSMGETYTTPRFALESGVVLSNAQIRYRTFGLTEDENAPVLVICHALTGSASVDTWWGSLLGPGRPFDTDRYRIVCCNILGSCYGSTSPNSINEATGERYGIDFPAVTVQDTVRIQLHLLREHLQIPQIHCVIGGSFGGMQAMEYAVQTTLDHSDYVQSVIPIACNAQHSAWQIAVSEIQRQAIYRDPAWTTGDPFQATTGLQLARQIAMISYRTPQGYATKFGRATVDSEEGTWQVQRYLDYQGIKFIQRSFDPITYVKLTQQMDTHDISRHRSDDVTDVLRQLRLPALILGLDSDILYPLYEQRLMAQYMPHAKLQVVTSPDGHDGFLLEQEQVGMHIRQFLNTLQK
jgi:homoserine O-acetyltransferase/O-succinyltransferase